MRKLKHKKEIIEINEFKIIENNHTIKGTIVKTDERNITIKMKIKIFKNGNVLIEEQLHQKLLGDESQRCYYYGKDNKLISEGFIINIDELGNVKIIDDDY